MLVTVLTPVFNMKDTIARTMESVLAQTYRDIEYIVLDGGSDDGTTEIIRSFIPRFQEKKMTLRLVIGPDRGMYDALNKGAAIASGCIIGNINGDDWYEPEMVERMAELYRAENYDIAWSDIRIIGEKHAFVKHAKIGKWWTTAHFCHPSMFRSRQAALELPYALRGTDDDFDMILRAVNRNMKICVCGECLANYMLGGAGSRKHLSGAIARIRMKYDTYRRNGFSRCYLLYCAAVEIAKLLYR